MFKYICRICSEVSFTLEQAEFHFKNDHCSNDFEYRLKLNDIEVALTGSDKGSKDYLLYVFTKTLISTEEHVKAFELKKLNPEYIAAPIKCEFCYKVIKTLKALKKHKQLHYRSDSARYMCAVCRTYFRYKYELLQHSKRAHDYKYTCKECGHVVYNRKDAIDHRSLVHTKQREKKGERDTNYCNVCNIQFETTSKHREHMYLHGTNFCYVCGRTFSSKNAVAIHVTSAHGGEWYNLHTKATYDPDRSSQFYCGECHVQFHNAVAYNRHLTFKEHKDPTPVNSNADSDQNEVQTKEIYSKVPTAVPRLVNCHLCGVYLSTRRQQYEHYQQLHTLDEYNKLIYTTTYKCEQCDYTTMRPRLFNMHVRKHKVDFTIPCQICGKRFKTVYRMKLHLTVHSDEKPYECEHCHKTFKTKRMTRMHITTVHLKIPYMPWVRRAERRKRERELERQKRAEESQGKDKNKYKISKIRKEEPQQDMNVNMMEEEQYLATEYLSNFALSGNVVFATLSR